jgi:hypothetical protein
MSGTESAPTNPQRIAAFGHRTFDLSQCPNKLTMKLKQYLCIITREYTIIVIIVALPNLFLTRFIPILFLGIK